jgi:macrolide transport system ATP-binding/permease protein
MLNIENLSKYYGPFLVLNDISFSLNKQMRVGLVGANGVGKSTLLKIIAGRETADAGTVSLEPGVSIGYLPQTLPISSGKTVEDTLAEAVADIRKIESRMRAIENELSSCGDHTEVLLQEYGELSRQFEERGGYELDHRFDVVMEGLGISYLPRSRTVDSLSGGEKTRLGLAGLLLGSPDVLLLDEPTNNLDTTNLQWLEGYLGRCRGAVMMASHDRQFLNATANWIYEIDEHTHNLQKYAGNYNAYKTAKERERAKWEEDYQRQQHEIKELKRVMQAASSEAQRRQRPRDKDKYALQFKAERSQAAATRNIRAARERLERIMENPVPKPPRPLQFKATFAGKEIRSAEVVRVTGLSKSYGSITVLRNIDFHLGASSRAVIIGPNGSGKTTLLRIITGGERPDAGSASLAPNIRPGYLPQEPRLAEKEMTILDYYRRGRPGREEDFIFGLVTCGLFRYDELNKTLAQMSLGQRRKLEIACLIAAEPNVLFLDEPTNHLSLDILESFEKAILDFNGPVLAVSHDRRFVQNFHGETWELREGRLTLYDSK